METMRCFIAVAAFTIWTSVCADEIFPADVMWGLPVGQQQISADAPAPAITIAREGGQVTITFTGTLQSANTVSGPWTVISNAVSPFKVDLADGQSFFRTQQTEIESVFSSREIVAWTLTGPFQKYFELAFAGTPDGIFPP